MNTDYEEKMVGTREDQEITLVKKVHCIVMNEN